ITDKLTEINQRTKGGVDEIKKVIPFNKLYKLYGKPTDETINNNEWVTELIIVLNVLLFLIIIAILLTSYQAGQCPPTGHLLLENAVIFIFVGAIEALFFITTISHYIPTPPSAIAENSIKSLKKHLKQ